MRVSESLGYHGTAPRTWISDRSRRRQRRRWSYACLDVNVILIVAVVVAVVVANEAKKPDRELRESLPTTNCSRCGSLLRWSCVDIGFLLGVRAGLPDAFVAHLLRQIENCRCFLRASLRRSTKTSHRCEEVRLLSWFKTGALGIGASWRRCSSAMAARR
jgi:hypothetical protein